MVTVVCYVCVCVQYCLYGQKIVGSLLGDGESRPSVLERPREQYTDDEHYWKSRTYNVCIDTDGQTEGPAIERASYLVVSVCLSVCLSAVYPHGQARDEAVRVGGRKGGADGPGAADG